jgi:hypothetical protein
VLHFVPNGTLTAGCAKVLADPSSPLHPRLVCTLPFPPAYVRPSSLSCAPPSQRPRPSFPHTREHTRPLFLPTPLCFRARTICACLCSAEELGRKGAHGWLHCFRGNVYLSATNGLVSGSRTVPVPSLHALRDGRSCPETQAIGVVEVARSGK